jgi:signal transduction histidine kinase
VEDSGPGISEASAERIFDRFYTSRSGDAAVENASGLGCLSVGRLLRRMGGTIKVGKSALGGARFEINFFF